VSEKNSNKIKLQILASYSIEFTNTLATKFLSAIDEQCSVCEDDSNHLVMFLSSGYGCQLVVALNLFANQVGHK